MNVFNEGTIESFALGVDCDIITEALSKLNLIIDNTIADMKKVNAFLIGQCEIIPINEFSSGAVSSISTLDIFLTLTSSQIEFNTIKLNQNKFKNFTKRIKWAWENKDVNKKKKKKLKAKTDNAQTLNNKYDIFRFNNDFLNSVIKYLNQTTICSIERGVIKINGDCLPFDVRIFPVINKFGSYNFFLNSKNKFINIDFKNRFKNIEDMYENYGETYLALIRIFNSLYYNIYNKQANQFFIESLVLNLPAETFFKETNYSCFVFAMNFFANVNLNELKACTDLNKKIFEEKLCGTSLSQMIEFMQNIKKYID
ncbi:MAG: hypothetical protein PHX09_00295 [Clostridia bacterium]|nr:hypothetical protein [Clostridia bacterium]MDD4685690.1 hypothetical protein [Clostridia bacterium]